jgi:hypothetical protein
MNWLRTFLGTTSAATLVLTASQLLVARADSFQARQTTSRNPACAVLTIAEVQAATGFPGYKDASPGDPPGEGAGGGASCQFSAPAFAMDARGNPMKAPKGPLLSLVLIDGKNYTRTRAIGRGCRKEAVAGVGDEAYFEVCPGDGRLKRTPPLYVKAGVKDLIVQMDIEAPDTDAAIRPKVTAVAKAAAAKIR